MVAAKDILPQTGPALTGPDRGTPVTAVAPEAPRYEISSSDSRKVNDPLFSKPVLPKIEANDSTVMPKEELDKALSSTTKSSKDEPKGIAKWISSVAQYGVPKWLRDTVPLAGTFIASFMHLATGLGRVKAFFPKPIQSFLERFSLPISKTVNAINYLAKSVDASAAVNKRGYDALGRMMHVLLVPFAPLEDIFLASGISSGLTQTMIGVSREKSDDPTPKSAWEDIVFHFRRIISMLKDLMKPGALWGKDRLIFKKSVPGSEKKDEAHLLILSAMMNIGSTIIGIGPKLLGLPEFIRSPLRKFAALVRNAGSILSDYGKYKDPSLLVKAVGGAYLGVSALDISQTFIKDKELKTTVNHFLQPITNFANFLYAMISSDKTDKAKARDNNGGVKLSTEQIHKAPANEEMAFAA